MPYMDTKTKPSLLVLSVVLLSLYQKSHVSLAVAADTITANQTLSGDQTIVSKGGVFELGFFKPGNSSNFYIGMWYYKQIVSEQTIVWVANREQPVSDRFSSELRMSDGNLVLFNESKIPVWSTNLPSITTSGSVEAHLLNSGNLVLLRAGTSTSSTISEPLWQSFDYPAHTFLPGGRIGFNTVTNRTQILTSWKSSEDPAPGLFSLQVDPNGANNAFLLLWNRSIQYWTSGPWDESSHTFYWVPEMRLNYIYNYSYVTNENETYFTYSLYDPKIVSRCVMHTSGQIQQLTWLKTFRQWNLFWSQPRKQCEVHGFCGAFGSCNERNLPACSCLTGFEPKSYREWDLQAYTGGCSRKTRLQYCGKATSSANGMDEDGYMEINSTSWPTTNKQYVGDASYFDAYGCKYICSNNCPCTAWAYEKNIGCSIWIGDLLGVQLLEVGDGDGKVLHVKLAASNITSGGYSVNRRSILIAAVSTTTGLLTLIFGYFFWKRTLTKRRNREHRKKYGETIYNFGAGDGEKDTELPLFALRSVLDATNNFSEANKLGEGGFGPVYKGILSPNQEVAIKRLSKKSGQGHYEFMNELKLIAKLQHTNLVRLLGCCIEEEERILIYEFMPNRSLDKLLFDPSEKAELDWAKRFGIIEGIAQGVLYIHKYSRLKIIHRDLKASNVLLDGTMNPKISDFGMARIFEINQTEANTNRVVGTYGYMSPEYARYGHFSEKLDVFGFGVLLLEIVSGKKNSAFYRFEHSPTLAGWAWELWKEGRAVEVIDESVRETCQPDEALRCIHVGFLCVQEAPADRPTMSSVIRMLHGNEATSLPPSKPPAFSTHRNPRALAFSPHDQAPAACFSNNNEITISSPGGR